jgi:hypothetical protein
VADLARLHSNKLSAYMAVRPIKSPNMIRSTQPPYPPSQHLTYVNAVSSLPNGEDPPSLVEPLRHCMQHQVISSLVYMIAKTSLAS